MAKRKAIPEGGTVMAGPLSEKILKKLSSMGITVRNKDVAADRKHIDKTYSYTFGHKDEVIIIEVAYPIPYNLKLSFKSSSYGKENTIDTDAGKLWVVSEVGKIIWAYLLKKERGWKPFVYVVEHDDRLEITIVLRDETL
jgi:hypothetical protein